YLEAEREVVRLQAEMAALDDELKVLKARDKQIKNIRAFSLEKVSRDTILQDVDVTKYGQVLDFITVQLREVAKARRDVGARRRTLAPTLDARRRSLAEQKSMTQLEQTSVAVTVSGAGSGATLELQYMLPGATWEPAHELRTGGLDPATAELTSYAVVTQTSGEDWSNATLAFATQSSSDAVRIPALEALTLGSPQAATRMMARRSSSFNRAKQAFGKQNMLWNRFHQKTEIRQFEQTYQNNFIQLREVQSKTVEIFRGLQQRGTSAHFRATKRATVRGDGRPVRVNIGQADLKTQLALVAAPERSLNAARTVKMTNSAPRPLLPGKVGLYKDGGFLGLTNMDFVAEGEDFSMFLGVADHVKLARTLDKKHSSLVRKVKTRMTVSFIVTAENLSNEPTRLTLADRVPVSQNRDIRVDRVNVTPKVAPNSQGLLSWDVTLAPKERRTFRVSYRVEYPPTLILKTRRAKRNRAPSQAAPAFNSDEAVGEQLMNIEEEM
ncbi:MAG: hypothetical protein ACI9OJ_002526, partial [Myxococcota bacterium]